MGCGTALEIALPGHWAAGTWAQGCSAYVPPAGMALGMGTRPPGGMPCPPVFDRDVMRLTDPVRVCKSIWLREPARYRSPVVSLYG